jgi:peptidoglycan/xylan/chitin deacetylase (PgdA/CDA1 family)
MIAPCYHLVADQTPVHVRHLYPCRTVAAFERELDWLLARFRPVTLEQVLESQNDPACLPGNSFFLSFDDGFREMAEIVGPICKRKGVPVTFFLTTDFLDNRKLGYRHKASLLVETLSKLPREEALAAIQEAALMTNVDSDSSILGFVLGISYAQSALLDNVARFVGLDFAHFLRAKRPYLTSEEVHSLLRDGFSIGAHSLDHPRYSEIPLEEQLTQTRRSVDFLGERFAIKQRAFAFPFVSDGVDSKFYQRIFSEDFCDLIFYIGAIPSNEDWPVVERFGVERNTNEPIWTILRDMKRRRFRARMNRWIGPVRQLVK